MKAILYMVYMKKFLKTIDIKKKKLLKAIDIKNKDFSYYKSVLFFSSIVFILILLTIYISSNNREKNFSDNINLNRLSHSVEIHYSNIQQNQIKKNNTIEKIPIAKRKSDFISRIFLTIREANEEILAKREKIFIIEKRLKTNSLTVLDADSLKRLFREYNVKNNNITELKNRVDIIPISLAIAQAAIESGWGTSRFALEGNAFFGQKIIGSNVKGIRPIKNPNPYIKVRTFNTLKDSVNAYAKNLNTHKAYQTFRQVRKEKRSLSQNLEGSNLVNTLRKYSELGEEYTEQVQSIIEKNNLEKLNLSDDAREIMNISILTNAHYPNRNISEKEFLNFEEHKTISKKALKTFYQDKPFLGTILNILYLPTIAMSFISDLVWWNRYYKGCKEVEIIKKRLKSYE